MRMTLPSGLAIHIGINYADVVTEDGTAHQTTITFSTPIAQGKAVCSPGDTFQKLLGRKMALMRLFQDHPEFSKEDRAAIYKLLCPAGSFGKLPKGLAQQIDWRKVQKRKAGDA